LLYVSLSSFQFPPPSLHIQIRRQQRILLNKLPLARHPRSSTKFPLPQQHAFYKKPSPLLHYFRLLTKNCVATLRSPPQISLPTLHIQIRHQQRILLNKLPPPRDNFAHQQDSLPHNNTSSLINFHHNATLSLSTTNPSPHAKRQGSTPTTRSLQQTPAAARQPRSSAKFPLPQQHAFYKKPSPLLHYFRFLTKNCVTTQHPRSPPQIPLPTLNVKVRHQQRILLNKLSLCRNSSLITTTPSPHAKRQGSTPTTHSPQQTPATARHPRSSARFPPSQQYALL